MEPGGRIVTRRWPDDPAHRSLLGRPRDDLLLEEPERGARPHPPPDSAPRQALAFTQAQGPFTAYRRTVVPDGDELVESTEYGVTIPWFGWLFRWPVRGCWRGGSRRKVGGRPRTDSTRRSSWCSACSRPPR